MGPNVLQAELFGSDNRGRGALLVSAPLPRLYRPLTVGAEAKATGAGTEDVGRHHHEPIPSDCERSHRVAEPLDVELRGKVGVASISFHDTHHDHGSLHADRDNNARHDRNRSHGSRHCNCWRDSGVPAAHHDRG